MKKVFFLVATMVAGLAGYAQFSLGIHATGNAGNAHVQLQDASDIRKKINFGRRRPGRVVSFQQTAGHTHGDQLFTKWRYHKYCGF